MKVSLKWVQEFTNVDIGVDALVAKIGSQLGEVEEVIDLGEKYKGIVAVKVVSCEKHPNADKLSVCLIDDGGVTKLVERDKKGLVQVVCGAPNVRAGIMVAWIPPGAIVPSTFDGEQFKLEVRPLRGVHSNGMIASARELAINDDHEGIMVLDKKAKLGEPIAKVYDLDDYIIDIENKMFTHRPDCFGILGVAREIAGIQHVQFNSPDWYSKQVLKLKKSKEQLGLKVVNEVKKDVPRFMAVPMSGIEIGKSPIVMQSFLSRVGIKPINNVVDIANFIMYLTAQPLHAFDYDKVLSLDESKSATIRVRNPKKGEKISLLNGKTIEPRADAIMIASESKLIGIGGVMGGTDTEIDQSTKNIIIECANFDMYSIRKTSMEHGLFTDSVTRFNKGQSPMQNDVILQYVVGMIQKLAGGEVAGDIIDTNPELSKNYWEPVTVTAEFINDRLGLQLDDDEIETLLTNVEFKVDILQTGLKIRAPFWRTDIEIPEDIVEEVGRLYGYDHLPQELPMRDLTPVTKNEMIELKKSIRSTLAAAGANEVLTYSFVHSDLIKNAGQDQKLAFTISNAISPDLHNYRLSLIPSLLDKVHQNIKAKFDQFALFEMNRVHIKTEIDKEKLPIEFERLALVFTANDKTAKANYTGAAYFQAKKYLEQVASNVQIVKFNIKDTSDLEKQLLAPFETKRSALVKDDRGNITGVVGEFKSRVSTTFKLPKFSAGFEISLDQILSPDSDITNSYTPLSKYPSVDQDITIAVDRDNDYRNVIEKLQNHLEKDQNDTNPGSLEYSIEPISIYQDPKSKGKTNYTFKVTLWNENRTLTTKEVNHHLQDELDKYLKTLDGFTRV
ncbi:MAG: phenylalanine--tRNA ligase subunit beta [bacterium]|nr:phenylalanine--tRNA ligase subunit beta [bacterium]